MKRYFFLDESGDPGLSLSVGTSSHFILALVQMTERAPLSELAMLRKELYLPATFEFKYHSLSQYQKNLFFQKIRSTSLRVRAAIVDKSQIDPAWSGLTGQEFVVELIVQLILRASDLEIANDVLIIDGAVPSLKRALRIRISTLCRERGRVRPFKKIVGGNSRNDDCLQVADMIAGAIKQHEIHKNSLHFYSFSSKVDDLWYINR